MEAVSDKSGYQFLAEDQDKFEHENIGNKEVLALVRAFSGISDQKVRKDILTLVKSLANNSTDSNGTPSSKTTK